MQRTQTQNTAMAGTTRRTLIAVWILFVSNAVYGQSGLPKPETPLLGAAISGNTAAVKGLLKAGANPDEERLLGLPAVMFPLMMQNRDMFQAFLDAKADLQVRDRFGATTLMWSVYNADADQEIVKTALEGGGGPQCHAVGRGTI